MKDKSMAGFGGICAILVGISYIGGGLTYLLLPAEQRAPASFGEFMASVANNATRACYAL